MRYLIFAMVFLLHGCQTTKPIDCPPCPELVAAPVCDTMAYMLKYDSLRTVIAYQSMANDSMANRIDTYAKHLLRERTRMESIKKYVRIVNNNRSQSKFLLGWMNRALAE